MSNKALLINYRYCTGCHTCEVACQMEHNLPTDQWGIKLATVGPWEIRTDVYEFDNVPIPTDQCNLCAERTANGKEPTCVKHCWSKVIKYGTVEELAPLMEGNPKMVLFTPQGQ